MADVPEELIKMQNRIYSKSKKNPKEMNLLRVDLFCKYWNKALSLEKFAKKFIKKKLLQYHHVVQGANRLKEQFLMKQLNILLEGLKNAKNEVDKKKLTAGVAQMKWLIKTTHWQFGAIPKQELKRKDSFKAKSKLSDIEDFKEYYRKWALSKNSVAANAYNAFKRLEPERKSTYTAAKAVEHKEMKVLLQTKQSIVKVEDYFKFGYLTDAVTHKKYMATRTE